MPILQVRKLRLREVKGPAIKWRNEKLNLDLIQGPVSPLIGLYFLRGCVGRARVMAKGCQEADLVAGGGTVKIWLGILQRERPRWAEHNTSSLAGSSCGQEPFRCCFLTSLIAMETGEGVHTCTRWDVSQTCYPGLPRDASSGGQVKPIHKCTQE